MNHSEVSVRIPIHGKKDIRNRVCLSCQKSFKSSNKFNRMCKICKASLRSTKFTESGFCANTVCGHICD